MSAQERIEEIDRLIKSLNNEKNLILDGPFGWFDKINFGTATKINVSIESYPGGHIELSVESAKYDCPNNMSYECKIYHEINHEDIINKFKENGWSVTDRYTDSEYWNCITTNCTMTR